MALLAIGSVSLVGCAAGTTPADKPAASQSATAAPKVPGLGEKLDVKQSDGVASVTIEAATYGQTGDQYSTPPKNGGFLTLDILWETKSGTTSYNGLYFEAKADDGHAGDMRLLTSGALGSGDLPAGDKVRGKVMFDIGAGPYTVDVLNQMLQSAGRFKFEAAPQQ